MFGMGFDPVKDDLKEDPAFKGSIWEKLEQSKYLCPECGAHLKASEGELICLNSCHLPKHWQRRFSKTMEKLMKQKQNQEAEIQQLLGKSKEDQHESAKM